MAQPNGITLRAPSTFDSEAAVPATEPPALEWMLGTWHVTYATLPMWKSKCNVRITYTKLPEPAHPKVAAVSKAPQSGKVQPLQLDDLVEYQSPGKTKVSSVHGVSTSDTSKSNVGEGWAFNWRGKGWLVIASSHWEILGYGKDVAEDGTKNEWIVTYFTKTLFTPAGIDLYSRSPKLSDKTLAAIKDALRAFEDPSLKKLAGEIFEVPTDHKYMPGKGDESASNA